MKKSKKEQEVRVFMVHPASLAYEDNIVLMSEPFAEWL